MLEKRARLGSQGRGVVVSSGLGPHPASPTLPNDPRQVARRDGASRLGTKGPGREHTARPRGSRVSEARDRDNRERVLSQVRCLAREKGWTGGQVRPSPALLQALLGAGRLGPWGQCPGRAGSGRTSWCPGSESFPAAQPDQRKPLPPGGVSGVDRGPAPCLCPPFFGTRHLNKENLLLQDPRVTFHTTRWRCRPSTARGGGGCP